MLREVIFWLMCLEAEYVRSHIQWWGSAPPDEGTFGPFSLDLSRGLLYFRSNGWAQSHFEEGAFGTFFD